MPTQIAAKLCAATWRLRRDVTRLEFARPVTHVYNPLDYARAPHRAYIERFGGTRKRVVFLGMNPGPFGMCQTGVPFGSVENVRDWLDISGKVAQPASIHPKRPILGFDCPRKEVSGTRLWGAIAHAYGEPEGFFARHYIANYCPLVFLETTGRNRTPDKLPVRERALLFEACDRHLRRLVRLLDPEWVIGIGAFAEGRALETLSDTGVRIGRILHPSPANPRAQRDWGGQVKRQLQALGVCRAASMSTPELRLDSGKTEAGRVGGGDAA
jgi:single-strand selective monofunctional uracil DNA glycosylase